MFALKNYYFKSILFIVVFVFLSLSLGVDFSHNHSDSEFHNDCPACNWLINVVFTLSVFLILLGIFLNFEHIFLNALQIFISKFYRTFQYLRGPPILV